MRIQKLKVEKNIVLQMCLLVDHNKSWSLGLVAGIDVASKAVLLSCSSLEKQFIVMCLQKAHNEIDDALS